MQLRNLGYFFKTRKSHNHHLLIQNFIFRTNHLSNLISLNLPLTLVLLSHWRNYSSLSYCLPWLIMVLFLKTTSTSAPDIKALPWNPSGLGGRIVLPTHSKYVFAYLYLPLDNELLKGRDCVSLLLALQCQHTVGTQIFAKWTKNYWQP